MSASINNNIAVGKQKESLVGEPGISKPSAYRWDDRRERKILSSFSHSLGRQPSPTPSTGSHGGRNRWTATRTSRLRNSTLPGEDDPAEPAADAGTSEASHAGRDEESGVPPEEAEISTAALLFNRHDAAHPFCQTAIRQMVEQIFSDDHFDAAISFRTVKLTEKLLGYGLDRSKTDLVAADMLESSRHAKAARLGRTLIDDGSLHALLGDLKSEVKVPVIGDFLRKWQRELEEQMIQPGEEEPVERFEPHNHPASPVSLALGGGYPTGPRIVVDAPSCADDDDDALDDAPQQAANDDASDHASDGDDPGDFVYDSFRQDPGDGMRDEATAHEYVMSGALPHVATKSPTPVEIQPYHGEETMDVVEPNDAPSDAMVVEPQVLTPTDEVSSRRISMFSERFPTPLSVFIYHAHRLLGRKCTGKRHCCPRITNRAEEAWWHLGESQQHEWQQVCLQLQFGDSSPLELSIGYELFERQGLLDRLKAPVESIASAAPMRHGIQPSNMPASHPGAQDAPMRGPDNTTSSPHAGKGRGRKKSEKARSTSVASRSSGLGSWWKWKKSRQQGRPNVSFAWRDQLPDRAVRPASIAITCDDDSDNACRVAYIVRTPDSSALQHVDPVDFLYACKASFGDEIELDRCGRLHSRVWIAQFKHAGAARRALLDGASILYKNIPLIGEPFPRATKMVQCRPSIDGVTPTELVDAVRDAFTAGGCRLFRYPDDDCFVLAFPEPRFVFRLYVPLLSRADVAPSHVRFQPVDQASPCRACGGVHAGVCSKAERVGLRRRVH